MSTLTARRAALRALDPALLALDTAGGRRVEATSAAEAAGREADSAEEAAERDAAEYPDD